MNFVTGVPAGMGTAKNSDVTLPSNRSFGYFFAAVFMLLGWVLYDGALTWVECALGGLSFVTLFTTILIPSGLTPFNRGWMWIGHMLGHIFNPIILGIIFYVLITPTAVILKLAGRDELHLNFHRADSHWKARDPIPPTPDSFRNQF